MNEELLNKVKSLLSSIKYGQYTEREKIIEMFENLLLERENLYAEVASLEEELLYKNE